MHRAFKYPLHPTAAQEVILLQWLSMCCDLYNAALQERREGYKRDIKCSYVTQSKALTEIRASDLTLAAMPIEVQRSALDRLDGAFQGFFRRVKAGAKPGFPRWQRKRRYDSFSYNIVVKNIIQGSGRSARLAVPKLGAVKVNAYRPLQGVAKTVTIRRDSRGRWWACVACNIEWAPMLKPIATIDVSRIVGIDLGITSLIATSHGEVIENPRHAVQSATKLAARQRVLVRRKKGSSSRNRARILVAKTHQHIANQRRNHAWHVAKRLVSENDIIAHEDLNIAALARGILGKHVNFAGWTLLLHAIRCKAEEAGAVVVAVDPRGTSQLCSRCSAEVRKGLADRWHECPHCGLSLDRDVNAALNVKLRSIAALGTSVEPNGEAKATPKTRSSKRVIVKTVAQL